MYQLIKGGSIDPSKYKFWKLLRATLKQLTLQVHWLRLAGIIIGRKGAYEMWERWGGVVNKYYRFSEVCTVVSSSSEATLITKYWSTNLDDKDDDPNKANQHERVSSRTFYDLKTSLVEDKRRVN